MHPVESDEFSFGNAVRLVYQHERVDVRPYGRPPEHVGISASNADNVPGMERGESGQRERG